MTKIEEADLTEINSLRTKLANVVSEVGQASLQVELLKKDIKVIEQRITENTTTFEELLKEEQTLVNRLSEKYGTGSIDFETGEFTPEK